MNPSRLFILRPVATSLLMVAIFLSGLIAYRQLALSALPEVDYPTIQIVTFYPGASPDVMTSSIAAPLERQFGQMPGLKQMSSTNSGGATVITLQFNLELNLDVAEQEVQAAINAASNLLPVDLPAPPVYSKVNPADTPILTLGVTSATLPLPQVQSLVDTRLAQKISQVTGVGLVTLNGGQRPAVRVQVNPKALAAKGLNLEDVRAGIGSANVNQAKGSFDGPQRAYTIDANDQLRSAVEYGRIIIAYRNGAPIYLSDVADVIEDAENTRLAAWMNDVPAVIVNVQRQPGANVIEVVDRVKQLLPQLQASLPAAIEIAVLTDRTVTIRASVRDVQIELLLAIALVVLVIYVFLRNVPATLIPSVAVPLSLVGTFGVMYLAGFSINNLTLMALTIATGFVVDDAIVMIENITRYIEAGEEPLAAALKGAQQIGFTIISLTFSLIAVLIPLLFMGRRRPSVPRIRDHACSVYPDFRGGLADADADDVRAPAAPHARRRTGAFLSRRRRLVRLDHRTLWRHLALGARPPAPDPVGGRCHAGPGRRSLYIRAEGIFSGAGHRFDPGHFGGAAVDIL